MRWANGSLPGLRLEGELVRFRGRKADIRVEALAPKPKVLPHQCDAEVPLGLLPSLVHSVYCIPPLSQSLPSAQVEFNPGLKPLLQLAVVLTGFRTALPPPSPR